jgi:hypothetical protein
MTHGSEFSIMSTLLLVLYHHHHHNHNHNLSLSHRSYFHFAADSRWRRRQRCFDLLNDESVSLNLHVSLDLSVCSLILSASLCVSDFFVWQSVSPSFCICQSFCLNFRMPFLTLCVFKLVIFQLI